MVQDTSNIYPISEVFEKFGLYQVSQYILICLPTVFITMIDINYVFVAGDLNYRCRVPECDNLVSSSDYPSWWPDNIADRCLKPILRDVSNGTCTKQSFTNIVESCNDFIYESNNTVIAELNLGCQPWKSNLIGTVHSTGMLISMIISGWLCDKFGRKPTVIFSAVGSCVGHLKTFATSYYIYIAIEFLEATLSGASYSAAMVLMLEIGGKDKRVLSGVIFAYAIYMGECLFAVIAMFVPYWKTLIRIMNTPSFLFISYIVLIKESPRWQIVSGKIIEAKKSLQTIIKVNNININHDELANINEEKLRNEFRLETNKTSESYKEIFTSWIIVKRLFVASVCRYTASFVYYGLMINSVFLPGNKYTNFLLSTVMSFPGELISMYFMNKIGRILPLIVGFFLCGAMCVTSACVPNTYTWAKISLFLFGKMIVAACFTGAITYSMELFPTSTRGSLLGLCSFASRVGGMLAPLTPVLNPISESLPPIIFGCFAVASALLMILTPETKDLPLMDTIKQVEEYERETKNKNKNENTGNS